MRQRPPAPGTPLRIPGLEEFRPSEEAEARARVEAMRRRTGERRPAQGRRGHARAGRSHWLRYVMFALAGLGTVGAVAVGALVTLAPVDFVRDEIIREVKARTGRNLVVTGGTSLALFPAPAVALDNVALSAPDGMVAPPLVTMRRLEARTSLYSLVTGRIGVEQLVLTDPVIELTVDANGRRSWDFTSLQSPRRIRLAQAPGQGNPGDGTPPELTEFLRNSSKSAQEQPNTAAPSAAVRGRPSNALADHAIGFDDVRIVNGVVRYKDARTARAEEVRRLNAVVAAPSPTRPLEAKGDFDLRGERVSFQTVVSTPAAIVEQRNARVTLALATDPAGTARLSASFAGTLSPDSEPVQARGLRVEGPVRIETASVRALAGLFGADVPASGGPGPLAFAANLQSQRNEIALVDLDARLDDATARGNVRLVLDAPGTTRPRIKADLRITGLDLDRFTQRGESEATDAGGGALRGSAPPDLPVPRVKGYVKREGWSEQPYDTSAFGLVDAEARLGFSKLKFAGLNVEAAEVTLALDDRVLKTTIGDIRLYGGRGRGLVNLDARGRAPAMGANFTFNDVAGLAFMKDAADLDWIDGRADIQLALAGRGESEKILVESLNGRAKLDFADGAIVGINVPQMVRALGQGRLSEYERLPTARTDFSEAGASFEIKAGVAESRDVRLSSPLVRMTGAGIVDIGQRTIEATLRPRLVGSLSGQGGAADLGGLELPVKVSGPWTRPEISADMGAVLKDPEKAVEALKEIGRQLKSKGGGIEKLLERLLR